MNDRLHRIRTTIGLAAMPADVRCHINNLVSEEQAWIEFWTIVGYEDEAALAAVHALRQRGLTMTEALESEAAHYARTGRSSNG